MSDCRIYSAFSHRLVLLRYTSRSINLSTIMTMSEMVMIPADLTTTIVLVAMCQLLALGRGFV